MSETPLPDLLSQYSRRDWVRLSTLIVLRWMAIGGQLLAITVAERLFQLMLPVGLCYLAVGVLALANIVLMFVFPMNKLLSEGQAMAMLLFDILQLGFLLAVTGGLTNPFALLILAPVTISASALPLRTTVVLGIAAVAVVTVILPFHIPLRTADGGEIMAPLILLFGFWLAIIIGLAFSALYAHRVTAGINSMSDALFATQMALAREQKLTDLGGVVAAAAHELGTPLATIKLTSAELIEELADRPELAEDARLIRDQADRCRDILRSMGRAGKDDLHMHRAPISEVIREAAEPHQDRGKALRINLQPGPGGDAREPEIARRPEVIHGLRNLVQNAVDFARSTVWIDVEWTLRTISVRIIDDGDGFPPQMIGRIGDPFVSGRRALPSARARPGYEGMGLGLFIAKTLLERTGAELSFANGADPFLSAEERPERGGAVVAVVWPRGRIAESRSSALGPNPTTKS